MGEPMKFASRQDAGRQLGIRLDAQNTRADLVVGLPRGGVIVADEVARALNCRLDILVVRKIGHPQFREFAVGALAEGGVIVLDEDALRKAYVRQGALEEVIAEETVRLNDYSEKFGSNKRTPLAGQRVILVDDGLATGATAEAAVRSAQRQGASAIVVAIPIASENGYLRLANISNQVIALSVDPAFEAVGQYYQSFPQATDEEVLAVLSSRARDLRTREPILSLGK
ncbi:MAG: hypothetical protein EXS30_09175 [Pedosphaera sp.]|nr:hypothetical protein [Pedosphaera sp.]